ncbi:MAG: hypothetical protein COA57_11815 [Flavobacteriales bacterium]|nr:MAG: hypothetical protein COA57_11815 [Flavobacteriales bacterium]
MVKSLRFLLFLTVFFPLIGKAQSISPAVISAGGGFFGNGSNSISFTVSELMTETYSTGDHFLTQGFQQPTPYIISFINEDAGFVSDITLYPNPFNSQLNISISTPENNNYQIHIYDINGRLTKPPVLLTQSFGLQVYSLDVNGLASGIYIVRVLEQSGQKHSEFKIIRM